MYRKLFTAVFLFSLALSCFGASVNPSSLATQSGRVSTSDLSALRTKDQSGTQDTWKNYVEFYGDSAVFKGTFTFDVSNLGSVSSYSLNANFKGPTKDSQVWQFEWFVPATNSYIGAGDNAAASSWKWSLLSFAGTVPFASLVSNGQVKVRFSSNKASDNCDLDFLELSVVAGNVQPTNAPSTNPPVTQKPTSTPATLPPISTSTPKPTSTPTTKPTSTPTTKPTSTPTTKPTSTPTTKPTSTPKPGSSSTTPGGRKCPAGQVWQPTPGTTWEWQLTGTIDQSYNVQMYDIDLFDNDASVIQSLHDQGRVVICYFSTQYEDWRSDAASWPANVLGSNLDDWPGERYVDIRAAGTRDIMKSRLQMAADKGCDGVEPDNVDGYTNNNGFNLKATDQIDFNTFLATEAHARGLSVGLKNDIDQAGQLVAHFDWALNEQCNEYGECDSLKPFTQANKAVFGVEYSGSAASFCPKMVTAKYSWLLKKLALDATVQAQCCTYATGGCADAPYSCVDYSAKRSLAEEEEQNEAEFVSEPAEPIFDEEHSSGSAVACSIAFVAAAAALALTL